MATQCTYIYINGGKKKNGHNLGMTGPIWLNIELGRDFMALSIFSKFGDDPT